MAKWMVIVGVPLVLGAVVVRIRYVYREWRKEQDAIELGARVRKENSSAFAKKKDQFL
jgi:hypothetical protein